MPEDKISVSRFEGVVVPHLEAAYNLARWIMGNDQDAEDMVQEAYLRAYKYFGSYQGGNSRSWLLKIVRNTCYTWLHQNRAHLVTEELEDESYSTESDSLNPEIILQLSSQHELVREALVQLPLEFRELIILREMEGMSYKEIAVIEGIPIGTVMSRLARGRQHLKECLLRIGQVGDSHEP